MKVNPAFAQDFLCHNFGTMNQRKYIISAVLVLLFGTAIYFGFKKLSQGKDVEHPEKNIDMDEPVDTLIQSQQRGKMLFMSKCASCHHIFKDLTGPVLAGVTDRWPNKKELFAFIRNPAAVMARNSYARKQKLKFRSMMPLFPDLTDKEIQDILNYIVSQERAKKNVTP